MLELSDAVRVGVAAAHQAAEYIIDNLVTTRADPTTDEAEVVIAALCSAIATLEFNVRVNMPAEAAPKVRKAIDELSKAMDRKVTLLRSAQQAVNKEHNKKEEE